MPYKPPRDPATVRCLKMRRDKNGDFKLDLVVLFEAVWYFVLQFSSLNLQTGPEWRLTDEDITDLKEVFKIYDTDQVSTVGPH